MRRANEELTASNAELRISNEETKIANANTVRRMDRTEQDSRFLKNFSTETDARRYVESLADHETYLRPYLDYQGINGHGRGPYWTANWLKPVISVHSGPVSGWATQDDDNQGYRTP